MDDNLNFLFVVRALHPEVKRVVMKNEIVVDIDTDFAIRTFLVPS